MNKVFCFLLILISLFNLSCEESFSPKEEFKERYVLYGDFSMLPQVNFNSASVHLFKTYDVEGYNPYTNKNNPVISKADVVLSISGKEYKMVEDTILSISRYDSIEIAYNPGLLRLVAKPNDLVKVTAKLPNGKILSASTTIPSPPNFSYSYQYSNGFTTNIDRSMWGSSFVISWSKFKENLYFPRLVLSYSKKVGQEIVLNRVEKEIPLRFVKKGDKFEPVYPGYTWETKLDYSFEAIDSTLAQISGSDPEKGNYIIHSFYLRYKIFDEHLAKYFSSTKGFLDEFSIRLDESTYTNVSGGIGVFGSEYFNSVRYENK